MFKWFLDPPLCELVYKLQPDWESLAMGTTNDNEHSFITVYKWVTGQDHVVGCKQQRNIVLPSRAPDNKCILCHTCEVDDTSLSICFVGFYPFLSNMHVVTQWAICLIECVSCNSIDPLSSSSDLDVICFHLDALDVRGHCS